jgi:DNA-binding transcriptional MerR regulator/methylmalonyl-CoA mutase cobalamin-binding subunit
VVKTVLKDHPRHPIRVVTERTGLSAHVLRAWERRYDVVRPVRGESGRRVYRDADIERLALLNRATRSGRSIASVVGLGNEQLREMVAEDAARASLRPTVASGFEKEAMLLVRALAPERLETLLRRALLSLGALTFLAEVVDPLMIEIGTEWHEERITIAQEHAAAAVVMQLLVSLVRELEVPGAAPLVAMATPRGERHAIGAMMAAVAAAHDGWRVTWLGADLPAAQIASAAAQGGAHVVALSVVNDPEDLKSEVAELRRALAPHVPLIVGGVGARRLAESRGLTRARDLPHWRALLRLQASNPRE